MAKQSSKSKELAKVETPSFVVGTLADAPDYLPTNTKLTGMENIGKDDIKTPRIILLQGLSPQLSNFPESARNGHFWHTGMNVSLGQEFEFVPIIASKRVILWRPRNDQGGGILAFSRNGKTWDSGAGQKFSVKLKGRKEPVIWATGKDVLSSRLTEFGTSDPDDSHSAPAASLVYEYLVYLPKYPELSPCVLGVSKTAVPNGKEFNTSLAMIQRTGKPISCVAAMCFAEKQSNNDGEWTVPKFKTLGFIGKDLYMNTTSKLADAYGDYQVEYTQEETGQVIDDNIAY